MTGVRESQGEAEPLGAGPADDRDVHRASVAASLRPVTRATAAIELLVGAACLAMAWPCWRRGGLTFLIVAAALAVAGLVAIANALVSLV
jgi:hypothetical protein